MNNESGGEEKVYWSANRTIVGEPDCGWRRERAEKPMTVLMARDLPLQNAWHENRGMLGRIREGKDDKGI